MTRSPSITTVRTAYDFIQEIDIMSSLFTHQVSTAEPPDYVAPSFPSLYFPFPVGGDQAHWLYNTYDIWYFTVAWHLIFFGAVHVVTSAYACLMQYKSWKVIWIVPVIYAIIGGIEAIIAGSIVGGL